MANVDHHLVNEAIITMGHIAKQLAWSLYYALVQQYLRLPGVKLNVFAFGHWWLSLTTFTFQWVTYDLLTLFELHRIWP